MQQFERMSDYCSSCFTSCFHLTGLMDSEKSAKAEREKDKGNEAFRSGDYEEALTYYTRSINLIPTVAAQNNRAQSCKSCRQRFQTIMNY